MAAEEKKEMDFNVNVNNVSVKVKVISFNEEGFCFCFSMPQRSFCPIGADLFQLLRDSCCNKQPSRLFFFFSFLYVVNVSSVHLYPHFASVTETSSLHLLVFICFYWFLQSEDKEKKKSASIFFFNLFISKNISLFYV